MLNYFDSAGAAALYAKGRPYFHKQVMRLLAEQLRLNPAQDKLLNEALDVGCGTGLSTRALKTIARHVVGVDVSASMIAEADPLPGVTYTIGSAEALPVPDKSFDLVTVSSAIHWLDQKLFFAEVRRVLRPNGYLAIYENGFQGTLREKKGFTAWVKNVHLAHYPTPPRGRTMWQYEDSPDGWDFVNALPYENEVLFTREQLVDYLLTQSNTLAAWESGRETLEQTSAFLHRETAPFFADGAVRHALFRGTVWLLRASER